MKNNDKMTAGAAQNGGLNSESVEAAVLCGSDEAIQDKILAELEREKAQIAAEKEQKTITIENFAELPEALIFSDKAVYTLFNRDNKLEFFINGCEVERRIGQDEQLYNKLKNRAIKAFCVDNSVIKFSHAKILKSDCD